MPDTDKVANGDVGSADKHDVARVFDLPSHLELEAKSQQAE
jgi:hypothetical protein